MPAVAAVIERDHGASARLSVCCGGPALQSRTHPRPPQAIAAYPIANAVPVPSEDSDQAIIPVERSRHSQTRGRMRDDQQNTRARRQAV
jgi:hypothetical protein